jgi:gas vesicle protein
MPPLQSLRVPARRVLRPSTVQNASRVRFQSTGSTGGSSSSSSSGSSHLATGVASGTAAALVCYGLYTFTPSGRMQRKINQAAYEADKAYKEAASKLQEKTPNPQQALDQLRDSAYSYAAFIPGGRSYVDTAFKDLDTLREGHGEEVDKIVRETYDQLRDVSKGNLSLDTLSKALDVLGQFVQRIGHVAADGLSDLADNHPQLKEKLGPGADQLKQLGERLGPEAKKEVDHTWEQASQILKSGFTMQSLDQIRKLIQEKTEKVKKLGDKAWSEGLQQAKPMLDKNPQIKQLVEENADALKQGNATELFQKVKDAASSGNVDDLRSYVENTVKKISEKSTGDAGGLERYLQAIPGGSDILPKLKNISNLSDEKTEEAEKLLKETAEQLKNVLSQQSQKAEELLKKSGK